MYPKISDFINALFGTRIELPIQTYGFFVALAFITAGFFLYLELKRKEREGLIHPVEKEQVKGKPASATELVFSFLIAFIIFYKLTGIILNYGEFTRAPQDYLFSMQGNLFGGLVAGGAYAFFIYWQKKKKKLPSPKKEKVLVHPYQLAGNILLVAAISGIAGAKLFDVIEHLDDLVRDPVGTIFSFSGLAFYGGLIVATIAVSWYAERNSIPWPVIGDSVAPGLMLAYGVGRIGCQASGDGCWGIVNTAPKPDWLSFLPDWMWAFDYPHNVIDEGVKISGCVGEHCHMLEQAVFPTPFYETVMATIIFIGLWSVRKKIIIPGVLFSIYLILNGIERFLIEKIRINLKYDFLGMQVTQAEIIAVGLIVAGIAGIFYFRYRYSRKQTHGT
jgi:prolipoprotein diacylglyceryltransferase